MGDRPPAANGASRDEYRPEAVTSGPFQLSTLFGAEGDAPTHDGAAGHHAADGLGVAVGHNGIGSPLTAGVAGGAGEEPYIAPGRSTLRHLRMVTALTVIGVVAGAGYGLVRPPTYTSTATLYVGKTLTLDNVGAIAGLSAAAQGIAQDYARLISTGKVVAATERTLHVRSLPGTLTATEIAQTPEIMVVGASSSPVTAKRLAQAGTKALVAEVSQLNDYSSGALSVLRAAYTSLEVQITQDQATMSSLQPQLATADSAKAASIRSQITALESTISADTLQAETVQSQYQNEYSPYTAEEQVLQVASPAGAATSNRHKFLAIGAVAGLVVGFLVGVTLASYADLRGRGRHRVRPGGPRGTDREITGSVHPAAVD